MAPRHGSQRVPPPEDPHPCPSPAPAQPPSPGEGYPWGVPALLPLLPVGGRAMGEGGGGDGGRGGGRSEQSQRLGGWGVSSPLGQGGQHSRLKNPPVEQQQIGEHLAEGLVGGLGEEALALDQRRHVKAVFGAAAQSSAGTGLEVGGAAVDQVERVEKLEVPNLQGPENLLQRIPLGQPL